MMPHFIRPTIEHEDVQPNFECTEPSEAACHQYCGVPDCEASWGQLVVRQGQLYHLTDVAHVSHPIRTSKTCNIIDWLENDGAGFTELYCGEPHPLVPGEIKPVWQGDGYDWCYADQP